MSFTPVGTRCIAACVMPLNGASFTGIYAGSRQWGSMKFSTNAGIVI